MVYLFGPGIGLREEFQSTEDTIRMQIHLALNGSSIQIETEKIRKIRPPSLPRQQVYEIICPLKLDVSSRKTGCTLPYRVSKNTCPPFLLVLPSVSFLHKKEVGRVLLRGQFWRKKKIRRFSKPIGRRTKILSL